MKSRRDEFTKMFRVQFGKAHDEYLETYLALRESGDTHWDATETVRAEIQMVKVTKGQSK